jgi:hypothetical protein
VSGEPNLSELLHERAEAQYPMHRKVKMFSLGALLGFVWGALYFKD